MRRDVVSFDNVQVKAASDKALLCVIEGEEYWIPQTQIDDDSEVYKKGDEGKLVVNRWIAKQKGLVED